MFGDVWIEPVAQARQMLFEEIADVAGFVGTIVAATGFGAGGRILAGIENATEVDLHVEGEPLRHERVG